MKRFVREYLQLLLAFGVVIVVAATVLFVFVRCLGAAAK